MNNTKVETLLEFLNTFLIGNNLAPISDIFDFSVSKELLLNTENTKLFNCELIDKLSNTFESFNSTHDKTKNGIHYVMAILNKIIPELSDKENSYKFCVGSQCKILHEKIIIKKDICACLRNTERRRAARKLDPNAVCVCGLFQYRDQPTTTHTSYGDGKIKGNFNFPDSNVIHEYILNGPLKDEYQFVEMKTPVTQAFFDFDFKLHKHGLQHYLDESKIPEFTDYLTMKICEELGDYSYVYSDKNIGEGVHLFFPNTLVTKQQHSNHLKNLHEILILENWLNLPTDNNANTRVYELVLDKFICNNGICLMFQNKNGSHYKINMEKSTYPNIPTDKMGQLALCQLRR